MWGAPVATNTSDSKLIYGTNNPVLTGTAVVDREVTSAVWRWSALGVFVVASTLNFLDRQLLAAVAPAVRSEFSLSNADYGALVAAFSMTYTFMAPLAGWFVDRVGLRSGIIVALGCWSLAGIATGFVGSYRSLIGCRMALGAAEAAGIPASSKSVAVFLQPREFALGIALNSVGVTLGMMSAPLVAATVGVRFGWRAAFILCGVLGLVWLPLMWLTTARANRSAAAAAAGAFPLGLMLRDRRLWGILLANVLVMANYALWLNWTTIYFVEELRLTQTAANQYFAWIPPIFATLGGFFGGWLGLRRVGGREGAAAAAARVRLCCMLSPALLVTALVPLIDVPILAAEAISASVFACMTFLPNLHVVPIDLFGAGRAALTAAALASSYAFTQIVLSPAMGAIVDAAGFGILCVTIAGVSLLSVPVLKIMVR
jgi:ACS family hexuronate transporter-like MFS transporter